MPGQNPGLGSAQTPAKDFWQLFIASSQYLCELYNIFEFILKAHKQLAVKSVVPLMLFVAKAVLRTQRRGLDQPKPANSHRAAISSRRKLGILDRQKSCSSKENHHRMKVQEQSEMFGFRIE